MLAVVLSLGMIRLKSVFGGVSSFVSVLDRVLAYLISCLSTGNRVFNNI